MSSIKIMNPAAPSHTKAAPFTMRAPSLGDTGLNQILSLFFKRDRKLAYTVANAAIPALSTA